MSRTRFLPFVVVALVALFAAPTVPTAEAGDWQPVFEDTAVASVTVGDDVYVALAHHKVALEQRHNAQATLDTLGNIISNAPAATSANEFVMYGCYASGQAATDLENKGYDTRDDVSSSFTGASYDAEYTD